MLLFRRQLRSRIAELENELSEMQKDNMALSVNLDSKDKKIEELESKVFYLEGLKLQYNELFKNLRESNESLSKENAELRVTNKGLASSVSELKAKIRAKRPGKETAR